MNQAVRFPFRCIPYLLLTLASAVGADPAPPGPEDIVNDSLEVQKARNEHVRSRGGKTWYSHDWKLDEIPHYKPRQQVSGNIRIWGLNYIGDSPLSKYWSEEFRSFQPGTTLEFHLPTALTAIPALITGTADIGVNDTLWHFQRLEFRKAMGYDVTEIRMATGSYDVAGWANALGIFVHRDNPIDRISLPQLDGILGAERDGGWAEATWMPELARGPEKNLRKWGQLGLTGVWADRPIHVYGLNLRYHQAVGMSDVILRGSDKWNEDLRMYANYARKDGTLAVAAASLMLDLAKDPDGIAYSGMQNLNDHIKNLPLAVKDGGPYVTLSIETVQNRTYPLASEQYWNLNRKPGSPLDPKVSEFIRYVLSWEGQQQVVRDGKFLPLTPELARAGLITLETGRHPERGKITSSHGTLTPPADSAERDRVLAAAAQAENATGARTFYASSWDVASFPEYRPEEPVSGRIRIWGASTLASGRLSQFWESGFRRFQPKASIEWHLPTAMAALPAIITGEADLAAGDKLRFSDVLAFQRLYERDPMVLTLATGSFDVPGWSSALGIFVHPSNPLEHISVQQLDGVFGAARSGGWIDTSWHTELGRTAAEDLRTWGQLGLSGEWASRPIHLHAPEPRREESLRFSDMVLRGGDKWNGALHIYADRVGPHGTLVSADEQVAQAISKDRSSIGFFGNFKSSGTAKALAVSPRNGGPAVALTIDTVRSRTYPLLLSEYWFYNPEAGKPADPKVREFLRYVLSREGQEDIVRDGKYLPLTAELARTQRAQLK